VLLRSVALCSRLTPHFGGGPIVSDMTFGDLARRAGLAVRTLRAVDTRCVSTRTRVYCQRQRGASPATGCSGLMPSLGRDYCHPSGAGDRIRRHQARAGWRPSSRCQRSRTDTVARSMLRSEPCAYSGLCSEPWRVHQPRGATTHDRPDQHDSRRTPPHPRRLPRSGLRRPR
jgi:hypothetical protein